MLEPAPSRANSSRLICCNESEERLGEFNPAVMDRYQLIGYENRDVADQDFRNNQVDAGASWPGSKGTIPF